MSLTIRSLAVTRAGRPTLTLAGLEIAAGEVVGLIGPSGSGKSTAARAITGLLDGDETATRDLGFDFDPALGTGIGMVFQDSLRSFDPLMRIGDHAIEAIRWHFKLSKAEARAAAKAAFMRVGLPDDDAFLDRYPHQVSGGQRQRAAIAAAIALKPKLLIADEPTSALDVISQDHVARVLRSLATDDGMAVLFIGHDLGLMARVCDRLAVLDEGRLVEQSATAKVVATPAHVVTQGLIAAARTVAPVPATPGDVVLEARSVTRRYGALTAVDAVSFTMCRGEAIAIIGESGSGKSTLARTLLALDAAQSGEVRLAGDLFAPDAKGLRPLRRRIQAVFQDPSASFDPLWTVERLVTEPLALEPVAPDVARARAIAALERAGLDGMRLNDRPHQFSGGQKQKIALARALILNPDVLVLDEALSALDSVSRRDVLAQLAALKQACLAIVFVSHDIGAARTLADQVLIMKNGQAVEQGAAADVFANPQTDYARDLLAAAPELS